MWIKDFLSKNRVGAIISAGTVLPVVLAVPAFASDLSGVAITVEMLKPVIDGITANIGVILPIGVTLFSIMLGISLLPKILHKFIK